MNKALIAVCGLLAGGAPLLAARPALAQQGFDEAAPPAPPRQPTAPSPGATPPPVADPFAEPPPPGAMPPGAMPPPGAIPYPPPPLAEPMTPQGPRVILRSENPNPRLQMLSRLRWEDVCLTPCGIRVDPRGLYRIGGGTVRKTEPFRLPAKSGDVLIDVEAGSNVKHFVGLGLMIGGAVSVAYGAFTYLVLRNLTTETYDPNTNTFQTQQDNTGVVIAVTLGVIGAVLEGVGIALWNSDTTIHIH